MNCHIIWDSLSDSETILLVTVNKIIIKCFVLTIKLTDLAWLDVRNHHVNIFYTGLYQFLYRIINKWAIPNWKHRFLNYLCNWKTSCSPTSNWNNGFTNFHIVIIPYFN